jgi:penicillin-binding protein 1A
MSENQKYTGNKRSVFQNIGHKIAGIFQSKDKQEDYDGRGEPVFPPAGHYESKKERMDKDKTVIFTENEIKTIDKKQNFADTMFIPGIPGSEKKARKAAGSLFVPRTKRPNFVLGIILTTFKIGIVAIFVMVAVASGLVLGLANAYLETTPDLDVGKIEDQALSSYIYDQSGNLLATYTGSENRDWAKLDEIPVDLQHAVVAIEDIRFYSHNGVDIKRILGSFVSNMTSNSVQGGSTITQQVIKNSLLSSERSYKRKLQEAYLAIELEKKYTKDQILEAYLNTIPLGGTIYGVKAAAKDYFGKELSQLTLKQMVCLAAVTQYPHAYNPRRATYVAPEYLGELQDRMNKVVERMYAAGYITKEQFDATFVPKSVWDTPGYIDQWKAEMNILENSPSNELYPYPHFIEYVVYNVETHFLRKYGMEDTPQNRAKIENEIRSNGYKIYATIDEDVQNTVQTTISQWDDYPAFKDDADNFIKNPDGSEIIEPQASSVVIDNATGYIVAMIGSRDTPTSKKTLNRAYDAPMPVGSSIKPLAVYGPAFDLGLSPATPIANVPVPIPGWESETGYPTTSQGTAGPVSIREGIVHSWNIVAARTLMEHVGLENSASYLQKMDVNMDNVNVNGVGLALGSSGLTALEMAGAYACIANEGYYREPVAFTKVVDKNGDTVLDSGEYRHEEQVYKPSTAWMLVNVLTDAVDHGTGYQAQMAGIQVAGKTGTVVENRGVFFSGMTGYYTSTLWVGHDLYKPFISGTSALNTSAPLWQSYMSKIYESKGLGDKPIIDKTFEEEGLVEAQCDAIMGGAPVANIPNNTDYFLNGTQPTKVSDIFQSANICAVSGQLAGPNCPSVIAGYVANFPDDNPYAIWMKAGHALNLGGMTIAGSGQTCTVHGQNYRDSINYANSVIAAANDVLNQYQGKLTQDQRSELTSTMQTVQSVINRPDSSDEAINTSANILMGLIDSIRAAMAAPSPSPSASTSPPASTAPATNTPTTSPELNQ